MTKNSDADSKKPIKSEMLKSGTINYFLDLLVSQKGNKYLKITQSKFDKEKNTHERTQVVVFERNFDEFKTAISKVLEA